MLTLTTEDVRLIARMIIDIINATEQLGKTVEFEHALAQIVERYAREAKQR